MLKFLSKLFFASIVIVSLFSCNAKAQSTKRILFVVTSHSQLGNSGKTTGYYLSEVSHPWKVLIEAGYEIDIMSPQGGKAPYDESGFDMTDSINKEFWENEKYQGKIENTLKPSEVDPKDYRAIYYAGGHGTMWDFPNNKEIASIASEIYENNGCIAAVCHGPAALLNIKMSDGKFLIAGKRINSFTNAEEESINLQSEVPFALETALIEKGAIFEKSDLWQAHVVSDKRVITGQNPASAKSVGEAIVKELK